jgi:GNAT superfamily N-acetyltransferase
MNLTIRPATVGDIDAMHRVRVAVQENRLSRPDRISHQDYVDALTELGRGWVAESGGGVAGFAVGYRSGNIWALFVDPAHEGKGIARALHAEMLHWLRNLGLSKLDLTTAPGTRAETFYRKAGWVAGGLTESGERRFDYPLRPGALTASCHCGAVKLGLPHGPDWVIDCNCSLCRRISGRWAYYREGTVTVDAAPGSQQEYIWGDKSIRTMRCGHCGCVTHWEPLQAGVIGRWGVNTRNLEPQALEGVRTRRFDGADTWTYLDD